MDDPGTVFCELVEVMARLRSPEGCPWDLEQTHETLKPFLLEEAYEVLEAMEGPPDHFSEELGDLLLQIVFHAQLAQEDGRFDIAAVVAGIRDKMIRRHPHVFGDQNANSAKAVMTHWEQHKREERRTKHPDASVLDGVPKALPSLLQAWRLTEKASRVGFDWPDVGGVRAKLTEETEELDRAIADGDAAAVEHELGDLLFTIVNLGRFLNLNPEEALRKTNERFTARFRFLERALGDQGKRPEEVSAAELDEGWNAAKVALKEG